MMLAIEPQFCETDVPRERSLLSRTSKAELARESSACDGDTPDLAPFVVSIEDITSEAADAPVQYTMRVRCTLHDASWTMPPHRYSDFEKLHKAVQPVLSGGDAAPRPELPMKHLLMPTHSRAHHVRAHARVTMRANQDSAARPQTRLSPEIRDRRSPPAEQ